MRKKIINQFVQYGLLTAVLFYSQNFYAQFPYFNTAQSSNDFKVIGVGGKKTNSSNSPAHEVLFGSNGVMLIDNVNQYAAVSLESLKFTTEKGFVLEFEFVLDAGTLFESKYGDGISMILYDAAQVNAKPGDKGGALGYAHTRRESDSSANGFTNGFLGLGLDLFGNYKNIMANPNEIRNGITNNSEGNFVVLRGPYSTQSPIEGYPVLFAIGTEKNLNYYLDRSNASVSSRQKGLEGQRFSLRGNKLTAKPGDPEYRKAVISLVPGKDVSSNDEEGFFVSVDIVNGVYNSSVIKNYFIPKKGNIMYTDQTGTKSSSKKTLAIDTPSELKMAFAGSTGGASIRAHIRNISLSLPFSPIANDMSIQQVLVDRATVIKPLYSAFGYNSNVYSILNPPIKSILYLDKMAFRFKRMNPDTKQLELTPDPFVLDEPNVGVFKYDKESGEVIFTPVANFEGKVPYTFYYDIKNIKPASGVDISTEEYRSRLAAITLNFIKAGEGIDQFYPHLIINRGLKNTRDPKTLK